ncbi:auxin-induced 15A-like [Olea europaea subsp. europaea]|uniref:Auxin-induced 15A-like n=1 Tax=Olea europaea subsp. europaea TaxID=158383 RepID=A0A8S0PEW7_OLEEU|nr:auxin-induced 15A-like [Olea europaea subsp. europaea]
MMTARQKHEPNVLLCPSGNWSLSEPALRQRPRQMPRASNFRAMAIHMPRIIHAKQFLRKSSDIPKGSFAIYVGVERKRFVVPISYLNHPSFQDLLHRAEQEFGFDYPAGGLTLPCREDVFIDITTHLNRI